MAPYSQLTNAAQQQHNSTLLDPLHSSGKSWKDVKEHRAEDKLQKDKIFPDDFNSILNNPTKFPVLLEKDSLCDDEELVSLLSKEEQNHLHENINKNLSLTKARLDAVEWMLKVNAHYCFSAVTAILAVNYFDRFIFGFHFELDKPWMTQLAAVACLSLAAKMEEAQVPLLLDFQVEESEYVFEAKTIQKMEILVLSTLDWKMNPVTPLSFLDYITRRLGLKSHLCWEFLRRCELILLSIISDCRLMCYLPSVIGTAVMLHVVNSIEPNLGVQYQSQLLGILGIDKAQVDECRKQILDLETEKNCLTKCLSKKRKHASILGSPSGVMDVTFSSDSSNDSWSVSSSPETLNKKGKANEASEACNCKCF